MHIGHFSINTPRTETIGALAQALEARGYESLWVGEHPQIPCSRKTPFPAGGDMPGEYRRMMDPLMSLAVAAAATTDLRLGTGVVLPLEHDVFDLAKRISTLDQMSNGRVLFGVGVGWNEEELSNCQSFAWAERYRALAECIGALKVLWTDDEAQYHGQFYDFAPVWSEPKPLQRPYPPILCGMAGRMGTKHAVEWADGWMPLDIGLGDVAKKLGLFREAAAPTRDAVTVTLVAWGDPTLETLLRYRELGVDRVVLGVARAGIEDPSTSYRFIDRYAEMIDDLRR